MRGSSFIRNNARNASHKLSFAPVAADRLPETHRIFGSGFAVPRCMRRQGVLTVAVGTLLMVCAFVDTDARSELHALVERRWSEQQHRRIQSHHRWRHNRSRPDPTAERNLWMLDSAVSQWRPAHDRGDGLQRGGSDSVGAVRRQANRRARRPLTPAGRNGRDGERQRLDRADRNIHHLSMAVGRRTRPTHRLLPRPRRMSTPPPARSP